MICPHCRNEALSFPCPACGWTRERSLEWAAQECEARGSWQRAAAVWKELCDLKPPGPLDRRARCLARMAFEGPSETAFRQAEEALASALSSRKDWEEGHQMRIRLWSEQDKLGDLEKLYRSEGSGRWADLAHLVVKFREDDAWKSREEEKGTLNLARWVLPPSALLLLLASWRVGGWAGDGERMDKFYILVALLVAWLLFALLVIWVLRIPSIPGRSGKAEPGMAEKQATEDTESKTL